MFRLIAGISGLIAIIVVMVLNLENKTNFNLFGIEYSDIPVYVVSLISFALGVLYSLAYCLGEKIRAHGKRKAKLKNAAPPAAEPAEKEKTV